jgi:short-subunit dehydrogenase
MRKAIIIGASSGIGRELALGLAAEGYSVGITGRRLELLTELSSKNPVVFIPKQMDITNFENTISKLIALVQELGGLDLLILSSATGEINRELNFDIEQATCKTNVMGFTNIVDWSMSYFISKQSGHLVVISSIAGLRGNKDAPAYNASKAYQINYTEALRQKVYSLKLPITITDIRPGFVDTDMAKGDGKFWVATVEKASKQIVNAINAKRDIVYVSKRWKLIAILFRILPSVIYKRI